MLYNLVFTNTGIIKIAPKKATASSEDPGFPPKQAIDGNIAKGFISHNHPEFLPWLMVKLTNQYKTVNLQKVKIFNRKDCCGSKLRNIEVRAGTTKLLSTQRGKITDNIWCGEFKGPGGTKGEYVINCNPPCQKWCKVVPTIPASVVTIQITDHKNTRQLGINEVEFFQYGKFSFK